jgi:TNF receptor-associated factor 2
VLSIVCSLCEWNGLFKDYEEHFNQAHPNPICEFCGEKFNSTIRLDEHKQKECTKITVPCPLKSYGCLDSVYRVQLSDHYLTDIHQKAIINVVTRSGYKVSNEQHEKVSGMDVDVAQGGASSVITTTNESMSTQVQEIYETINILASGIQTLNDDTQRLSSESIRLQTSIESLTQDFGTLKLSIQEQSAFLDGIKPNQEILQQDVASLKQRVDDMQYVSYDGTLIWKITNFREKMMDAQSERQTSIYSPPFYSSPTGYKMRARLYLHGDGNARRTHMSLFFVLMRGPNDAILKFPFNYKVTFCLYDQTPQVRHIIDSFRPDIKSNSFQRPRSEMNIASGIPKFFPLAMIQQEGNPYVRDDTMFIKVMVDFGDIPKTLLPFAFSLNPGLPTNIQQDIIRQEAERRAQPQTSQQQQTTN